MEYVAGSTARAWCQDRTAREIIELYVAVGDGLAAAHAAGLVHRDFKPDNILVGEDGRGRVADFGLARDASAVDESIAGTPKYMAPEQVHGEDVDERADQYAFCVSLGEALKGKRPPRHVEAAVRRGTASVRTARWPSMAPLLQELRRKPASPAKIMGLGALVAVVPLLFVTTRRPHVDPCAGGAKRIGELWPERYVRVHAALVAPGRARVGRDRDDLRRRPARQVDRSLGGERSRHLRGRVDTRTARSGRRVPGAREARSRCHARDPRRAELRSREAARCRRRAAAARVVHRSAVPRRARAAAHRSEARGRRGGDAAGARSRAGAAHRRHVEAGESRAREGRARAESSSGSHFTARIHHLRATIDHAADDGPKALAELTEAYFEARATGEQRRWRHRTPRSSLVLLLDMSKDVDAAHWGRLAEVESSSLADPQLQAHTLTSLSVVATARGDATYGLDLADRAVRLNRSLTGANTLASALNVRSEAYSALGKYDLALADLDESDRALRTYAAQSPALSVTAQQRSLLYDPDGAARGRDRQCARGPRDRGGGRAGQPVRRQRGRPARRRAQPREAVSRGARDDRSFPARREPQARGRSELQRRERP